MDEAKEAALTKIEAELLAADARVEQAEARYNIAARQAARALAKQDDLPTAAKSPPPLDATTVSDEKAMDGDGFAGLPAHTIPGSKDKKNASQLSDKVISHDKWLGARGKESRAKEAAKKSRERLRRQARDKKFEVGDMATPASPSANSEAQTPMTPVAKTPEELAAADSAVVAEGAQGIADRLKVFKELPNASDKLASLLKVVTGGRAETFTFEPATVVKDLKDRGLCDGHLASELLGALTEAAPAKKGTPVPPEEWLEHAKSISAVERKDAEPFKASEITYLQWVEDKDLQAAESQLEAAEKQLEEALSNAVKQYPDTFKEESSPAQQAPSGPQNEVDDDDAQAMEDKAALDKDSKGAKNYSQVSDKAHSREKWEKEHSQEARDREGQAKARDNRRTEARDLKYEDQNQDA